MQKLKGLSEVASRYDGILFDLYGVIHNGVACFSESVECLRHLQDQGVPYTFLSNMPLRAARVANSLAKRGMPEGLTMGALTSGEAVFSALSSGDYGKRYTFQGPDSTREIIPEGYEETDIAQADFVLVTGIGDEETPSDYTELLEASLARNLPMICGNPDLRVGQGSKLVSCAGLLVDAYERMGGDARWMGKPHKAAYEMAADILGKKRLLMVGDSLRTDVAGAIGVGLDSVFIESGIHAGAGEGLFAEYDVFPTYRLDRLRW